MTALSRALVGTKEFLTCVTEENAGVVVNDAGLGIVEAIAAVVAVGRYGSRRSVVGQLRSTGRFQAMTNLGVKSSVVAVAVGPVFLSKLQTVWKYVFSLKYAQNHRSKVQTKPWISRFQKDEIPR